MRVLLVADGRSPTTLRWLNSLLQIGYQVRMISSYPCDRPAGLDGFEVIPLAFSQIAGSAGQARSGNKPNASARLLRQFVGQFRPAFLAGRYILGPISVQRRSRAFVQSVEKDPPDLVHALRIPFEGMLASTTPGNLPLIVSIWGNDLTLHSKGSPWMKRMTEVCLTRAQGLISDTHRDIRLGHLSGFPPDRPTLMVPGSGGINLAEINQARSHTTGILSNYLPAGVPLIVNPRGSRPGSLRNDVFFRAIPLVLRQQPDAIFFCPAMAGNAEAVRWITWLKIKKQVRLMPMLPQSQLWDLFQHAQVYVSPGQHDGTPNSFLEAMACGCFPIVGDIESLREWITSGENGLLIDPANPEALANAILLALDSPKLRYQAKEINMELIKQRAEVGLVRQEIDQFYRAVVGNYEVPAMA